MQLLINTVFWASLGLLSALAFLPVLSTNRAFNFSNAAIFPLTGYAYLMLVIEAGLSNLLAAVAAIILGAAFAALLDSSFARPLRQKGLGGWKLLLATLGLYVVLQNGYSMGFGDDTVLLNMVAAQPGFRLFGARVSAVQILTVGTTVILATAYTLFVSRTRLGRAIRAVASNPELSLIYGIEAEAVRMRAAMLGGLIAGVVGILVGLDTGLNPQMGFRLLMNGVVVVLVAGLGGVSTLVAASILVAFLQTMMSLALGTAWMEAIAFVILVGFLIWKPSGFAGRRLKKVEL